jgi:DNA-binding beta-propeller fold protein YncE
MNRDAFELVDLREPYTVRRVPPIGTKSEERGTGSYMGAAFSPDGATFYYGSANEGRILVLDVATDAVVGAIDLNTMDSTTASREISRSAATAADSSWSINSTTGW